MDVKIVCKNFTMGSINGATFVPRIGDTVSLDGISYLVKEVVWHMKNGGQLWAEVKVV